MVTGLTANILAAGLTSYLMRVLSGGGRPIAIHLDAASALADSRAGRSAASSGRFCSRCRRSPISRSLAASRWRSFSARTQAGLTLRATGESPEAVFASGAEPFRVRMLAVVACGAVAGIGGAVLSLQQVGTFTDGMTGGRGYLALASLIVARWNPFGAAIACLAFGAAEAFELRMQGFGLPVSSYVVQMAPYLIALAVLAVLGRASRMPAAIGQPLPWDQ